MRIPKELREIAERNGLTDNAIRIRVQRKGIPLEEAVRIPVRSYPKLYEQYREIAELNGVSEGLFRLRRHKGMSPEEAASTPNKGRGRGRKVIRQGDTVLYRKCFCIVKEVIQELDEVVLVDKQGNEHFTERKDIITIKERKA